MGRWARPDVVRKVMHNRFDFTGARRSMNQHIQEQHLPQSLNCSHTTVHSVDDIGLYLLGCQETTQC